MQIPFGSNIFTKIILSHTVTEINVFVHFTQKFKMAPKMTGKHFLEKSPADSADTLWVKNFLKIPLSHTVSKINVFLHFTQKFKMTAKNGGKTFLGKNCQQTQQIPSSSKISSKSFYLKLFLR